MQLIDDNRIDEAYAKLPDQLREVLDSEETAIKINNIGKKYNLHIDQLGLMAQIIHGILLGIIPRSDFYHQLKKNIGLSEDQLNLITYELNQEIFSKIREELEKMSGSNYSPQQNFDQKMSGVSNVPKQEVEVETKTGDNESKGVDTKPPRDPYREPIL